MDEILKHSLPILEIGDNQFKTYDELVDHIEKQSVENLPQMELPLTHRITPGLYSREMFAPAGVLVTSKIHALEHQFFLLKGKILVIEESGYKLISAPYTGISKAGSRRVGLVLEDVIWTTVHATPLAEDKEYTEEEFIKTVEAIEAEVTIDRENKLLNT